MATTSEFIHQSAGGESLLQIALKFAEEIVANDADFWTFTFRRVRAGQEWGETIVATSNAAVTWPAGEDIPVLTEIANPLGLPLNDGDEIRGYISSTGTPAALPRYAMRVQLQREVL